MSDIRRQTLYHMMQTDPHAYVDYIIQIENINQDRRDENDKLKAENERLREEIRNLWNAQRVRSRK